ncbi:MAG: hypothetical protein IPN71_23695 [Fibrobacteres bacterium]|jgi:uncharacterized protein involved in exopolysaccharide biosynthesis|nr:hypothetical protein [Fibrobacterota bacterium]
MNEPNLSDSLDFDLRACVLHIWSARNWLVLGALVGGAIAAGYAYGIAKPVYESSALLLPTEAPKDDQLGAAAALLGKKSNSLGDVALYKSLLSSRRVVNKLLFASIHNEHDSARGKVEPLFRTLRVDTANPKQMESVIKSLSGSIVVESKNSTAGIGGGIIEVTTSASSPWLAQQIGNTVLTIGQEELRTIRIERADAIGVYLSRATEAARKEWDSAAIQLTYFRDRNRSLLLPNQILALSRLEIEKQAKEQKYLMARKELEFLELERAKAAPPMMILDQANLPATKVRPKRMMIMALGLMAGFFLGVFGVLGRLTLLPLFGSGLDPRPAQD